MKKNRLKWNILFLIILVVGTVIILKKQPPYQKDQGLVFGTVYNITYQSNDDLKEEIEKTLNNVDNSLSPFNKSSVISKVNRNENVELNSDFKNVFQLAQKIAEETDGLYDITVAPLVNAWGFGFKNASKIDSVTIDSIRKFVGYDKIKLADNKIIKADERIMLDCSSIAKGYGVDAVARLFDSKNIKNYMIDIGGEVVVKGKNPKMKTWRIGINKPIDDSLSINQDIETILEISNIGIATSGNYRNFYYKGGKKYAHTINPKTGYPVQHSILSATVIAKDCKTADAYATAFMAMGLEKSKNFCKKHPELEAYFICDGINNKYDIFFTEGMKKYIVKK